MLKKISMWFCIFVLFIIPAAIAQDGEGAETPKPSQTLINNVNIFDGKTNKLTKGMNVLIVDNLIETISNDSIEVDESATVIEGEGRTLMPGLIDNHVHLMLNGKGLTLKPTRPGRT